MSKSIANPTAMPPDVNRFNSAKVKEGFYSQSVLRAAQPERSSYKSFMKDFRSQIQLIRQESKDHFKKPKVETPQLKSIENRVKNKSYSPSRKKETVRIDLSDEKKLAVD